MDALVDKWRKSVAAADAALQRRREALVPGKEAAYPLHVYKVLGKEEKKTSKLRAELKRLYAAHPSEQST